MGNSTKYFNEYKKILKAGQDFHITGKKDLLKLMENGLFDCCFQPNFHWGRDNDISLKENSYEKFIDSTKSTLEEIVKRNNGTLVEKSFNIYEINYNINNSNINIIADYSKKTFDCKIERDGIPYIVEENNFDYFLFLYFLIYPNLIDENSFQYGIIINDKSYRYLKKDIALKSFRNIIDKKINEEIMELIEYKIDNKSMNGIFHSKKSKIILFNAFETTDVKLHIPKSILEVILLLNLEEEFQYNSLGFYFKRKDVVKGQRERQAIEFAKVCAQKSGYVNNKVGEYQICILYKNKIQITLSTHPKNNERLLNNYNVNFENIFDVPFEIKVEIIKDRNSIMHETLLEKRYGMADYLSGERKLNNILDLIVKIQQEDLDNVYVVLYNNKKDNSFYSNICYHTFEDALTLKDGFLDKTKGFEMIDLDMEKKLGKAYQYNNINNSLFYCAIAKDVKLAGFYADIIKKCEEHIYL